MSVSDLLVAGVCVSWFAALVVRQFSSAASRRIAAVDVLRIVPHFGLFAGALPCDYRFCHRVRRADGTFDSWTTLEIPPRPRGAAIWHPQLLQRHLLLEFADRAGAVEDGAARGRFERSPRYRAFLGFLHDRAAHAEPVGIQFIVFARHARDAEQAGHLVFVSDVHDVRPVAA